MDNFLGILIITGPMSLRVLSSRTVSIGDFDGSTGGGLTSVAPGILGVEIGRQVGQQRVTDIEIYIL